MVLSLVLQLVNFSLVSSCGSNPRSYAWSPCSGLKHGDQFFPPFFPITYMSILDSGNFRFIFHSFFRHSCYFLPCIKWWWYFLDMERFVFCCLVHIPNKLPTIGKKLSCCSFHIEYIMWAVYSTHRCVLPIFCLVMLCYKFWALFWQH